MYTFNSTSWYDTYIFYTYVYCFYIILIVDATMCPRNSYPFYIVTYYIKWVTTSLDRK